MFANLLDNVNQNVDSSLGETIARHLFGPAAFFWLGGLVAWLSIDEQQTFSTLILTADISQQLVGLTLGLAILIISDVIMEGFTMPLLQLLEGYYWLHWVDMGAIRATVAAKRAERESLKSTYGTDPVATRRYQALSQELTNYALDSNHIMPTTVGNILRAAEEYSRERYGLEAVTVWPRLWVLLSDELKQELILARAQLNRAVQVMAWGILFPIWAIFAAWNFIMLFALVIAPIMVIVGYYQAIQSATTYGDFIRTAFDLHRFKLYEALKWPRPEDTESEIDVGESLTQYLFYAERPANVTFK